MGVAAWSTYDEGYLQAYLWASSLAAGAALPQEATALPLGPGEIAHAHLAPVGVFGHFGEQKDYRRSFLLVGGPVGLALTRRRRFGDDESAARDHAERPAGVAVVRGGRPTQLDGRQRGHPGCQFAAIEHAAAATGISERARALRVRASFSGPAPT